MLSDIGVLRFERTGVDDFICVDLSGVFLGAEHFHMHMITTVVPIVAPAMISATFAS